MTSTGEERGAGSFAVELPVFTGPFRLLADLILDQKVDVCDVPVALVTDRFLAHSSRAGNWSLEEATWFLAACAVMLELKVGRLMPRPQALDEEDLLGVSPDLVYARSLELAAIRAIVAELGRRLEEEARFFPRDIGPGRELSHLYPDVLEKASADDLALAASELLRPPALVDLSHVTPIRFTVDEAARTVAERLGRIGAARFRELVADCEDRIHVVVRFLALLELYREGKVELAQAETFGEIEVRWRGGG